MCKLLRDKVSMMHPTAEDKVTIAVICYDLGEFARWHPRGKKYVNPYADFISYTEMTALEAAACSVSGF